MKTDNLRLAVCYEAALQMIGPLPRAVFLLCRLDDFSYREIGTRLAIEPAVVEDCIAFALVTFMLVWRGELPDRPTPVKIAEAEAELLQSYRRYCARVIAMTKPLADETSDGSTSERQIQDSNRPRHRSLRCLVNWSRGILPPFWPNSAFQNAMTFDEWLRSDNSSENNLRDVQPARPLP